jgi:hypothetical protein
VFTGILILLLGKLALKGRQVQQAHKAFKVSKEFRVCRAILGRKVQRVLMV